jgi:hypothetical protein
MCEGRSAFLRRGVPFPPSAPGGDSPGVFRSEYADESDWPEDARTCSALSWRVARKRSSGEGPSAPSRCTGPPCDDCGRESECEDEDETLAERECGPGATWAKSMGIACCIIC